MKNNISDSFILDSISHKSRWGFSDTKFIITSNNNVTVTGNRYAISGYEMPYLLPFVEEVLNVPFHYKTRSEATQQIKKAKKNVPFIEEMRKKFSKQFFVDDEERLIHSHGQGTADEVMKVLYYGSLDRVADGVFYCLSEYDVETLLKIATKHNVCLVPYGGGTSVSCALSLPVSEKRMIVVVDMSKLSRIIHIDKENKRITVEAGITGVYLEEQLNALGFTLGHEPDSLEFSTVGGWISTNASGMKKNRYGNIEDLVENYSLITPKGTITLAYGHARISSGVSLHKAFIGQEGNFGFITQATLKIFQKPQVKRYESLIFPDFKTGTAFLRALQDEGNVPASIRLVDNFQLRFGQALRKEHKGRLASLKTKLRNYFITQIKKCDFKKMTAATVVFEGSTQQTTSQKKSIARLLKKYKGFFGGSQNGKRGYLLTYAIAYIRDFMSDHYILGETYETTVPWNKIHEVCDAVDTKAKELHARFNFPGTCYVSPRITQLYQTEVCIYFTHGLYYKGVTNPEEKFSKLEKELRKTIIECGGSISHHHGVGKIRADFIEDTYSKFTRNTLQYLKKQIDPQNIMGVQNNIFYKQPKNTRAKSQKKQQNKKSSSKSSP